MKTSNAGPPNVAMKLFPFIDLHVGRKYIFGASLGKMTLLVWKIELKVVKKVFLQPFSYVNTCKGQLNL